MSIVRRGPLPTDHFTIVSNEWTRDAALTWEARGLLTWLAGHATGHEVTEDTIVAAGPAGRRAVRTMIQTLENAGYLRRERTAVLTGGSTVDYVLMDPRACSGGTLPRVPQQHPRSDRGKHAPEGLFEQVNPRVPQQHPRSTTEDQEKNKKTSSSSASRLGTTLPEDFQPDASMKQWFADQGYASVIHGPTEHAKFVDYWIAQPGAKGRKKNWPATWRNWMRNAADRRGLIPASPAAPGSSLIPASGTVPFPPSGAYRPSTTDVKLAQTMELGRRLQQQMEETA